MDIFEKIVSDTLSEEDTDNIINIDENIRYYNNKNTDFIGVFDKVNRIINYKFGILIKTYDTYIITFYGYFDNIYFYGSKEIFYKIPFQNNIKVNQTGHFKYNSFINTYQNNGYVKTTITNIFNKKIIYEEDLFQDKGIKDFSHYNKNLCEHCNIRECNILYPEEKMYVCIPCDKGQFIENRKSRYYFNNVDNINSINNRILINNQSILYKINKDIFIKQLNEKNQTISINKLELHQLSDETVNYYNSLNDKIKFILNNIDCTKINKEAINNFKKNII